MRKFTIQAVMLILLIAVALYFFKQNPDISGIPFAPQPPVTKTLKISNATLTVEIADTQTKRNLGLGGRQSLGQDEGMLFIFPTLGRPAFWMKGLTFPLDFVWIRGDKVVDILQNVPPAPPDTPTTALPIYAPKEDIDKVLEVNAGTVNRLNIKVGDTINLE